MQQTLLASNPFGGDGVNLWDWSGVPAQQINVHTGNASLPIAMNTMAMAGVFNSDMDMQQMQNMNQPLQELQYCFADASQVQNLNATLEEYSSVIAEGGAYGMNFLNMDVPGYCPLPLDL